VHHDRLYCCYCHAKQAVVAADTSDFAALRNHSDNPGYNDRVADDQAQCYACLHTCVARGGGLGDSSDGSGAIYDGCFDDGRTSGAIHSLEVGALVEAFRLVEQALA